MIRFKSETVQDMAHYLLSVTLNFINALAQSEYTYTITSAVRTVLGNHRVGGKVNSKHLSGRAVDIRLLKSDAAIQELKRICDEHKMKLIVEDDHYHVETIAGAHEDEEQEVQRRVAEKLKRTDEQTF